MSLDLGAVINDLSLTVGKYNFGQLHKLSFDLIPVFVTMKMRLIEVGINSPTPHEKALLPVEELVQNFETTKY